MTDAAQPIASPDQIASAFADAWNSHDMTAFDTLFAEDVDWTTTYDARVSGRAAVVADFRAAHADFAGDTRLVPSDVSTRRIRPDVAIIQFNARLTWPGEDAGVGRSMLVVAVEAGSGWRISAGQITKPNCPDPS